MKTCGCCGVVHSADSWSALPLVGYQPAEDPDQLCELRNCGCGSTIAITIPGPGFWLLLCAQRIGEARDEAHRELPSLSRMCADRATSCLNQALELLKMLAEQRAARAQAAE